MTPAAAALLAATFLSPPGRAAEPDVRRAVAKALPLLLKGAEGHVAQRTCFACHNQALPVLALVTARPRGFAVADDDLKKQADFIIAFLDSNRDNYRKGRGQGGAVDTASYALLTLDLAGRRPDATTAAVAEYLLLTPTAAGHWRAVANRPPSEASDFTTTYLALRGLRIFSTPEQKDRVARRVEEARAWLLTARARENEDRVFRLWGLREAGAEEKDVQAAAQDLLRQQRDDGGWGQRDGMAADAYATGSALVALAEAAGLSVDDPAYRRGVAFLLREQRDDGSWLVRSRSRPFQRYYETGFPHGDDQFISSAASGWAATALALTLPAERPPGAE
jgi:hypothetical protein